MNVKYNCLSQLYKYGTDSRVRYGNPHHQKLEIKHLGNSFGVHEVLTSHV